jgi:2'-5' RNA ligase
LPKRSLFPNPPSALPSVEANAADADTKERHERIWQEFLQRPAVFVYEPRFFRIPDVVGMLTVQVQVGDRSIRRRLRRVVEGLSDMVCIEPLPEGHLHMTVVPPALLTRGQPRPPIILPDGFEEQALKPMREALRGYGAFEVRIQGLNVFRDVLVAVAYDGGHSVEIRQRLMEAVPQLPEKYWNMLRPLPHISLAQFCSTDGVTQLRDAVAQLRDVYLGTLRVTRLYLVRSELRDGVFGELKRQAIPLTR